MWESGLPVAGCGQNSVNCGIHTRALIVKIQEYTYKWTILQYKVFTVETIKIWHVATLPCGSSWRSLHPYLYTRQIIERWNWLNLYQSHLMPWSWCCRCASFMRYFLWDGSYICYFNIMSEWWQYCTYVTSILQGTPCQTYTSTATPPGCQTFLM